MRAARASRRALAAQVMALASLSASCGALWPSPLAIVAWTPGEGRFGPGTDITASVTFSAEPDRARAESAFSLTEDGAAVAGTFLWSGSTLSLAPLSEPRRGSAYRLSVGVGAMTPGGASLEEAFEGRFTTRAEDGRPEVVATAPERGGILADSLGAVVISFSEPVDEAAYGGAVSFSPSIRGTWSFSPEGREAAFSPLEPWAYGSDYRVLVSAELEDECGNRMGEDYRFGFSVGEDRTPPSLIAATALDVSGAERMAALPDDAGDEVVTENAGWESSWRLRLSFSEPVSTLSAAARVSCEGGPALRLETLAEYADTIVVAFEDRPAWGRRLAVLARAGIEDERGNASEAGSVYRLVADGAGSRPPRFVGARLALAPGEASPEDRVLAAFPLDDPYATVAITGGALRYPLGEPVATSLELYLELAEGASLDALSVMEAFRASSTNGALEFSASRVVLAGLEYAAPYAPWAGLALARVDGSLTNRVGSGVVTIELGAGLADSLGNVEPSPQRLALLK